MLANLWENHSTNWAVRFGWKLRCLCANYPLCSAVPSKTGKEEKGFSLSISLEHKWHHPPETAALWAIRIQLLHFPASLEVGWVRDQSERGFCDWLWLLFGDWRVWAFLGLHWGAGVADPMVGSVWEGHGNGHGTCSWNVTAWCHQLTPNQGLRWKGWIQALNLHPQPLPWFMSRACRYSCMSWDCPVKGNAM